MTDFSIGRVISSLKFCCSVITMLCNIMELKKLKSVNSMLRIKGLHSGNPAIITLPGTEVDSTLPSTTLLFFFFTRNEILVRSTGKADLTRMTLPKTLPVDLTNFTRNDLRVGSHKKNFSDG